MCRIIIVNYRLRRGWVHRALLQQTIVNCSHVLLHCKGRFSVSTHCFQQWVGDGRPFTKIVSMRCACACAVNTYIGNFAPPAALLPRPGDIIPHPNYNACPYGWAKCAHLCMELDAGFWNDNKEFNSKDIWVSKRCFHWWAVRKLFSCYNTYFYIHVVLHSTAGCLEKLF